MDNWAGYMARFKEMAQGLDPYLVADVIWWDRSPSTSDWRELSQHFDAITGYNLHDPSQPDKMQAYWERAGEFWTGWHQTVRNYGLAFVPTAIPGYDDRNLRGQGRPVLERRDGDLYRAAWETAKGFVDEYVPLVLLTSFNEWHEGTEIEPSVQYEAEYLSITGDGLTILRGDQAEEETRPALKDSPIPFSVSSTSIPWYLWLVVGIVGIGVLGAITMFWITVRKRV